MDFLEFKIILEETFQGLFPFELIFMEYHGYSFGSGIYVYRMKGTNYKFKFDGRENILEIFKSDKHEKFPNCKWNPLSSLNDLSDFKVEILHIV